VHAGLRFGIFLAPFHQPRGNPTRALRRDIELVQHLDRLGFDEVWVGEHHSGGVEIVGDPFVFAAAALERTTKISIGTGVASLPYHSPLWIAERTALLDHLSEGRFKLGVGPGALPTDARMIGVDPLRQRAMLAEALPAVLHLLRHDGPLTASTDWFTLVEAMTHLPPYTDPHAEVVVAATLSPSGPLLAGRHGVGLLSIGATAAVDALAEQWAVVEREAGSAGTTVDRSAWRLVGPMHLAATREQALEEVRYGLDHWFDYFQQVAAAPQMAPPGATFEERVAFINSSGLGVIGTVEDAITHLRALRSSVDGFGAYLLFAHEWAEPAATWDSYERFSRFVMPALQGSAQALLDAQHRASALREGLFDLQQQALDEATAGHGAREDASA
jgi:limonene 1,2-monooxygenase